MQGMKRILSLVLVLSMLVGIFASTAMAAPAASTADVSVTAEDLQVEYMTTPLGLDVAAPRFSWELSSDARNVVQESYRVVAATSEAALAEGNYVWDTGVVTGAATNGVYYTGNALQPETRYYWQVTSTTNKGVAVGQSWFETGLMDTSIEAWDGAKWITDPVSAEVEDVKNYTIEWDFSMIYDGASLRFGSANGYYLVWQFNINAVERPYGGTPYFRPHVWNTNPACLEDIKVDHVIPDNDTGKHAWYHCKAVIAENNGVYTATTYLGPVGGEMTLIDNARQLPTNHAWTLGSLGFRQINDSNNKDDAYFDNIVITDNDAGEVIYTETFDGPDVPAMFSGRGTIENGTYRLGGQNDFEAAYPVVKHEEMTANSDFGNGEPLFRKSFTLEEGKTVASARLYGTARGFYEFSLNGEKVGDQFLAPGWTDYNYTLMYQTYDITDQLQAGENVVGAMLGQGWWSSPEQGASYSYVYGETQSLLGKLVITYTDGTKQTIVTDESWLSRPGPIQYADNYAGEDYDARYDAAGWNTVGHDTTGWQPAGIHAGLKAGVELVAQTGEPIREVDRFSNPVVTEPVTGRYTFDFGQNISGFLRIKIKGEAGTKITIKHAEMLNTETAYKGSKGGDDLPGTIYRANLRDSFARGKKVAIDTYVLKGDENGEVWMPTFTFHGFRYAEITGISSLDQILEIEAIAISSDNEITSTFESSNAKVNQLFSNVIWGMRGNFVSVPTDCPNRDERLGYTGDTQIFSGTGVYMANSNQFYSKWLRDLRDYQLNETSGITYGKVPVIIPMNNWTGGWPSNWSSAWGNAAVIVPWQLYQQFGDTQIIKDAFDSMKAWCDFQMNPDRTTDYLRKGSAASGGDNNYGDWLAVVGSDKSLTNTLYMANDFRCFSIMARVIGETEVADEYEATAKKIVEAILNKWGNAEGDLVVNTQTPLALFLYFNLQELSDTANADLIAERLMNNVVDNGNKLTTGFIGVAALLPALSQNGQMEAAVALLEQEEYPSWLYSVNQGATTTWERWNSYTIDGGFESSGMNSFNHYAYGAVGEWMMSGALGIRRDEANPGFTHFYLDPQYGGSLTYAKGSYDSVSGTIEAGWELDKETGAFRYTVKVPANTTATLYMPAGSAEGVLESGAAAAEAEGVTYVSYDAGEERAVYELASGSYSFTSVLPVKRDVTLSVNAADTAMPPVQAEVTMNGEPKTVTLPTTLSVAEGTEITIKAAPMNDVDYAVTNWTADGETVSENGTLSFTVTGSAAYTVNTTYVGITSLANGKSVTASYVNGDWATKNLTDGILSHLGGTNGWSSTMQGKSMTFAEVPAVIDLGATTEFNQVRLYARYLAGYGPVNFPVAYTIYVSDDNATWTSVYSTTNGEVTNGYAPVVINLPNTASGRYVKLGVTAVNRGDESDTAYVQLSEMGLYNILPDAATVRVESVSEYSDVVPMNVNVAVNGKTVATSLPVNLNVSGGDKISVSAELLNTVDYSIKSWTLGETVVSENGSAGITVSGDNTLTLNIGWNGYNSLAVGKTVIGEAVNNEWGTANLVDGKLSYLGGTNGWSSKCMDTEGATTFAETGAVIDLGAETLFNRFHIYPRNLPSSKEDVGLMNFPVAYTIYTSNDNATWTPVYTTTDGTLTNGFEPVVIDLDEDVTARYVKYGVTAINRPDENDDAYVQLSEFGVYFVDKISGSPEEAAAVAAIQALNGYRAASWITDANAAQTAIDTAKAAVAAYEALGGEAESLLNYEYIAIAEAALAQKKTMETDVYTIDFDFVMVSNAQGFSIGMKDTNTFIMWQVNAFKNATTDKTVILRPHFCVNGKWTDYPGLSGSNVQAVDVTDAIGYNTDTISGKTIHQRIEVNGKEIKTYFGPDADHLTLADTYTHTTNVTLWNVGFRHNSSVNDGNEIATYDNIVVRNGEGKVIFAEDFSEPENVVITASNTQIPYVVQNGQIELSNSSASGTTIFILGQIVSVEEEEPVDPDQEAADAVIAQIDAIGEVTLDSKEVIDAARTAYDALTDAQKALVTNADTLTAAEAAYAALVAAAEQEAADKAAAAEVDALIAAIGEVTLDSKDAIDAARAAYDALTDAQKALVTNADTLTAAEAAYEELTKVEPTPETVALTISGEESTNVYAEEVVYTVSATNMNRLATIELSIEMPEEILAQPFAKGVGTWYVIGQVYRNGVLTVVVGNNAGVTGEGDILTITAAPTGEAGDATVTITKAILSAHVGEAEAYVDVNLDGASTTTEMLVSRFDVNKDGIVDQLDMTRAQRYFGTSFKDADVNEDGEVDIEDLIAILNNYTEEE